MADLYPPGPKGQFPLYSIPEFFNNPLGFIVENARQYGDINRYRLAYRDVYQVNHPDDIHKILVDDADKYYKTRLTKDILKPTLGNGLLINDGDSHRRQRRLVQPAFHHKRIESYAEVMVSYTEQMLENWRSDQVYEIDSEMMALTMRIVAKTLFDADVAHMSQEIGEQISLLQRIGGNEFRSPILLPRWLPTDKNRKVKRAVAILDRAMHQIINAHRAAHEDNGDLLSMLLLAVDEDDGGQMTDQQLRDEAITLFIAGHETTSNTLTWTWYLLAQHPEVEARLVEELNRVLAGRAPTIHDLPNLPYTAMVIKESLRLYPAAWAISRDPIVDVNIRGYTIKKGTPILLAPYVTHLDPRFFEEPERFMPERFANGNEKKLPRMAYWPFGGGPRICIGQSFAIMEANLLLATIAQRFRLSLVPGEVVRPEPLVTLRIKDGMRMKVEARQPVPVTQPAPVM